MNKIFERKIYDSRIKTFTLILKNLLFNLINSKFNSKELDTTTILLNR